MCTFLKGSSPRTPRPCLFLHPSKHSCELWNIGIKMSLYQGPLTQTLQEAEGEVYRTPAA